MRALIVSLTLTVVLTAAGCGQKGELFLPDESDDETQTQNESE